MKTLTAGILHSDASTVRHPWRRLNGARFMRGCLVALLLSAPAMGRIAPQTSQENFLTLTSVAAAFYVKHLCSCLFVVRQPESFCHGYARTQAPVHAVEIDRERGIIRGGTLSSRHEAQYDFTHPEFGCLLVR